VVGEDEIIDDLKLGVTCVRKQTQLQVVIGVAFAGNPIPAIEELVTLLDPRWPDARDEFLDAYGNESGGIWSAVPTLSDMPSGFIEQEEKDTSY